VSLSGGKFLPGLITPADPKGVFSMLQSGDASDFIQGLTVELRGGVRNRWSAGGAMREAAPDLFGARGASEGPPRVAGLRERLLPSITIPVNRDSN
jgi:hypothetical protein